MILGFVVGFLSSLIDFLLPFYTVILVRMIGAATVTGLVSVYALLAHCCETRIMVARA